MIKNHGVLRGPLAGNWPVGSIPFKVINPEGNWYKDLVIGEKQYFSNFDTMSCVSFAADNACEIQIKNQTGLEVNFSDRFLAKASGTTQQGNWVSVVLDTLRKLGNVEESIWPKPGEPTTWEAYMSTISQDVFNQALKFKVLYDLQYEYIPDHSLATIKKHLQHAPLMITIPGHEVTGISVDDNGVMTILDDYIFNVDPAQPFIRKINITDIQDIFKAVLTVKGIKMIGYKQVGIATTYVELSGILVPVADWPAFASLGGSTDSVVELTADQMSKFKKVDNVLFKTK